MRSLLILVFFLLFGWMSYIVISTSLESNLFTEWNSLASIPWMRATLWDFYANVLVIYLWICYKETSWGLKLVWLIVLVVLGSIGTCIYLLFQLIRMKDGEGVAELLTKRNE